MTNDDSEFQNKTRGLFGNWSWDMADDLVRPDNVVISSANLNDFRDIHNNFGLHCKKRLTLLVDIQKLILSILFCRDVIGSRSRERGEGTVYEGIR